MSINLSEFKKEINSIEKVKKNSSKNLVNFKKVEITYCEKKEINNFLNDKTLELSTVIGNANLFLGKLFSEVKEFLEVQEIEETTYCKWLETNGFSRMTALRYRKRWEIYEVLDENRAKELIALAPQKIIDDLVKYKIDILKINKADNLLYLQNLIENSLELKEKEEDNIEVEENSDIDLTEKFYKIDIEKINNLDISQKKKVENLLKKIEKIIN